MTATATRRGLAEWLEDTLRAADTTPAYAIARTRRGRPTLQHRVAAANHARTVCGLDMSGWSRCYQSAPLPQVACKRCVRRQG